MWWATYHCTIAGRLPSGIARPFRDVTFHAKFLAFNLLIGVLALILFDPIHNAILFYVVTKVVNLRGVCRDREHIPCGI